MNLLTHITLSKLIYSNLNHCVPLDKKAFLYGNIKPDLTKSILKNSHIMDNYLIYVCNQTKDLMRGELSEKEFSYELGKVCHYVCDFFCRYHVSKELFDQYKAHFFYELKLHFITLKIGRRLIPFKGRTGDMNISSIIFDMRKEYLSDLHTEEKDIRYAISASIRICESVSCFLFESSEQNEKNQTACKEMMSIAGGQ